MIAAHCGEPVAVVTSNQRVLIVKCERCGRTFTQRKRLPRGPQR